MFAFGLIFFVITAFSKTFFSEFHDGDRPACWDVREERTTD